MTYPHYIVNWKEGRLPCPPQYRCTVIKKEFESGRIGGSRTIERRVATPQEASKLIMQDRFNRTAYEVRDRNTHRRRITLDELNRLARS